MGATSSSSQWAAPVSQLQADSTSISAKLMNLIAEGSQEAGGSRAGAPASWLCSGTCDVMITADANLVVPLAVEVLHARQHHFRTKHTVLLDAFSLALALSEAPLQPTVTGPARSHLPYHNNLHEQTTAADPDEQQVLCRLCDAAVKVDSMREHVGAHILHRKLTDCCGYCGLPLGTSERQGCTPRLSGNGQALLVSCSNGCFVKSSSGPCLKDRAACNNYPFECPVDGCTAVVWKYSLSAHCLQHHSTHVLAERFTFRPLEKAHMAKLQQRLSS